VEEVNSRAVIQGNPSKAVGGVLEEFLPPELPHIENLQTAIPQIAKDEQLLTAIARSVRSIPTTHKLLLGDARQLNIPENSVHLVLTSPPYWTLKEYRDTVGQMGHISHYEEFLDQLNRVWDTCYRVLVPGGATDLCCRRCLPISQEK
jgi:modification methylase